jgi:hypothetical protein
MVLGQGADRHRATTQAPPNPWAETLAPAPTGPLDLGAAQSRELHDALAAWAAPSGAPVTERADPASAAPDDADEPPEKKPGNWLC